MKKILVSLLKAYHWLPIGLLQLISNNKYKSIRLNTEALCETIDKHGDYFCSYRFRPQNTGLSNDIIPISNMDVCILIQGPFFEDFTIETLKLYKKNYPESMIIFSTWKGIDSTALEKIHDYGIITVLSDEPSVPGHLNINYQLVNTKAGIDEACRRGAKYICKLRSDQRIYHPMAFTYLKALVKTFPVGVETSNQKERVIAVTMPYGSMFQPFYISDFFYFGRSEDLRNMFSFEQDKRDKGGFSRSLSKKESAEKNAAPESIIMRNYARYTGQSDKCSIQSYWEFVKNSLICIGRNDIGLFWNKYKEKTDESKWSCSYDPEEKSGEYSLYNFDFCGWLSLYTGELEYDETYEDYAEFVFK